MLKSAQITPFEFGGRKMAVISFDVAAEATHAVLTEVERAVLESVLRGMSNTAIARERGVAYRTVANQLASIYKKFGVCSRSELLVHCVTRLEGHRDRP
ncbi:MAG TPA: helix-turn-helix transcriptional regulator [Polyangiaceae bacterium]|nr:helix-turn-helix transcriptional regulator [Polyangiaceae bacterium]